MTDSSRREPRTIQCRPELLRRFETLARELDVSVDFLINDAMRLYSRRREPPRLLPRIRAKLPPPPPPPPRRRIRRAPELEYAGQRFPIVRERFVIGRGKSQCDFTIKDPNVSRQHAAIEARGDELWVVDLGSTNGVFVDGRRVAEERVCDGSTIEISGHVLRVRAG